MNAAIEPRSPARLAAQLRLTCPTAQGDKCAMHLPFRSSTLLAAGFLLSSACAGHGGSAKNVIGRTLEPQPELRAGGPSEEMPDAEVPAEDVVLTAAARLSGIRTEDGQQFDEESLLTHLASADAVCLGERHGEVADHYAELRLVQALLERRELRGYELGVGLEMVRQHYQPDMTAFLSGGMSEAEFANRVDWSAGWGFAVQYYRPQMREALLHGASLLALGASRDISSDIAESGLAGLKANDARKLPQLDLGDRAHRRLFDAMMEGHPGTAEPSEPSAAPTLTSTQLDLHYQAQVYSDESMAEAATLWLSSRHPGRKLLILAGSAHCHPSAIPARIARRAPLTVVSVLPRMSGDSRREKDAGADHGSAEGSSNAVEQLLTQAYQYQLSRAD